MEWTDELFLCFQGLKVRELKGNKAEKSEIDKNVAILLDLKKQLALAGGQDPSAAAGGGKKKGKDSKQAPVKQEATGTASNTVVDSGAVERLTAQVTEQVRFLKSLNLLLYTIAPKTLLSFTLDFTWNRTFDCCCITNVLRILNLISLKEEGK